MVKVKRSTVKRMAVEPETFIPSNVMAVKVSNSVTVKRQQGQSLEGFRETVRLAKRNGGVYTTVMDVWHWKPEG